MTIFYVYNSKKQVKMRFYRYFPVLIVLVALMLASSCEQIDNKVVPRYTVRIDLGNYALWNTYGVGGMGDYRIFDRMKGIPSDGPLAYDLSCPVEASPNVTLSISSENFEAVCSLCGSHYDPLMGAGGPVKGVAINNKVGMRQYHVMPSNGGYIITN